MFSNAKNLHISKIICEFIFYKVSLLKNSIYHFGFVPFVPLSFFVFLHFWLFVYPFLFLDVLVWAFVTGTRTSMVFAF
jgi:hypothetical protein